MSKIALNKSVLVNFYGVYDDGEYIIKSIEVPLKRNDPCSSFKAAWLKFCAWSMGRFVVTRISMEIVEKNKESEKKDVSQSTES